jgi:hypothetical protein
MGVVKLAEWHIFILPADWENQQNKNTASRLGKPANIFILLVCPVC